MVSTTPAYNLKVVLKETGLAADTLRAWERRYGLPVTAYRGGPRLFHNATSNHKWLITAGRGLRSLVRGYVHDLLALRFGPSRDSVHRLGSSLCLSYQSTDAIRFTASRVRDCLTSMNQTLNKPLSGILDIPRRSSVHEVCKGSLCNRNLV